MAYDRRIRGIERLVPLAKVVEAGPDGRCKRPVSLMLGHLLPTCLQPFEHRHRPCNCRFGFTRESMLCLGDFLPHGDMKGLIHRMAMGTQTHPQDLVDQPQLFPFCIRYLELQVLAAIREFGDFVAVICKEDEGLDRLEQRIG